MIAQKLDQKIRSHLSNPRNRLFNENETLAIQRPGFFYFILFYFTLFENVN